MNFIDEVVIEVTAGKGGNGCMSFRREKNLPRGGPDGGDGGKGGSIFIRAKEGLNTLYDFGHKEKFSAKGGSKGQSRNRSGADGEDLVIEVPCGTVIYDNLINEEIIDLKGNLDEIEIVSGGKGGNGNAKYKSSKNRSPKKITEGSEGQERSLRMELKVLADVGLLGKPNAGKSSLVNAASNATPKIADYEFTTLNPTLGVVSLPNYASFVISDIPGLIAGASKGKGLGLKFLKHLSRTKVILLVVDIFQKDASEVIKEVKLLTNELEAFDRNLTKRLGWLVLNKIDLLDSKTIEAIVQELETHFTKTMKIYSVSATLKKDIDYLIKDLGKFLENLHE